MSRQRWRISRRIGRFSGDRRALGWLIALALALAGWSWLERHPQHNPMVPLDLRHPPGWATPAKLAELKQDRAACIATLERSEVAFSELAPVGDGDCARIDRTRLDKAPLSPAGAVATCPVSAGLELWLRHAVQPAARELLGAQVVRVEHLGTASCRRVNGGASGPWSQHATGNAIDIAAFVLDDGRRISLLGDWDGEGAEADFLRAARDGACAAFATVLSPDYNALHADHFHLDQGTRWSSVCR